MKDVAALRPSNSLPGWYRRALDRIRLGEQFGYMKIVNEYAQSGAFVTSGMTVAQVVEAVQRAVLLATVAASARKQVRELEVDSRRIAKERLTLLGKLNRLLDEFEEEADASEHYEEKMDVEPANWVSPQLRTIVEKGRGFAAVLEPLLVTEVRPLTADKTLHLANEFARQMRVMWADATLKNQVPRNGGTKLRRLSAKVWTDFGMERGETARIDGDLDDWLKERFKETAE